MTQGLCGRHMRGRSYYKVFPPQGVFASWVEGSLQTGSTPVSSNKTGGLK